MRNLIAILFFVFAIATFCYPTANAYIQRMEDEKNLVRVSQVIADSNQNNIITLNQNNNNIEIPTVTIDPSSSSTHNYSVGDPLGLIEIESIDLQLPILEGATDANMKNAATHIQGTAYFGEIGNVGIAAHRAREEGRLFSRLNEVTFHDEIKLTDLSGITHTYVVHSINIVKPNDVYVLDSNNQDAIVTLITCVYLGDDTDRLVIQATLVE